MALQPPIAAPRAAHELGALRVDARRAAAENLRRVKYQTIRRLKMENERQALEEATVEGKAETEAEVEEEEEQGAEEHQLDGRDTIDLPRLAAPATTARTKDKLRESMLEYTRRMAQYKNWRELRLQGSCVTAATAAAAVGERRGDERPAAGGGGGRAMPAAEERRLRRRAAAAAAVTGTSSGKESVAAAAAATDCGDLTVVDASPRDGTKARRSLADALSEMLRSAAAAIKIDGKSLNRPSPQRQLPSPPSQTSRAMFVGAEQPRLQQHEREMADEEAPPVDAGYRRFVAARAASPTRIAARQRPANAPRASADHLPSRDVATSAAAAAPPNSSEAAAGESGDDDGEYEGGIFEVVPTDGGGASLKRLLVLAAAAAAAAAGGVSEAFEGGRRPVRARRMKLPRPLLGSIVEDESEENDRAAAAAAARTAGRLLTFPATLAALPEAAARDDIAQAEATWRRDQRRNILLRLVNASNAAPHEVSKYMTSYARKKLLKLPALKATAERRR